ncbi:hypothetical protein JCM9279_002786 [Rhodotorula babjevae]
MSTSSSPSCPRRLPDELIIMVIERCNYLSYKRDQTLAALCHLNKRFKPAAERVLYSKVNLEGEPAANTVLYALVHFRRFRSFVKKVQLCIEHSTLDAINTDVVHVLCGLPHVEELDAYSIDAAPGLLLAHPDCRLRYFSLEEWDSKAARLMASRHGALAALEHLEIGFIDDFSGAPPVLPSLKQLSVQEGHECPAFKQFVAPLVGQITSLSLMDRSTSFGAVDLSTWAKLEHLTLDLRHLLDQAELESAISIIVAAIQSAPRWPGLASFALGASAYQRTSFELPASTNDILLALPPQLRVLTLLTNAIRAVDLATFLLSSLRPPALRTLRLGRALGRDFRAILNDAEGRHGALAGELERAGIEVTTTAVVL